MIHNSKKRNTFTVATLIVLFGFGIMGFLSGIAEAGPKLALDANGGRKNPYLNDKLAPNENLLWVLEQHDQYVRIIPKVSRVALDSNGGKGEPYFNKNLDPNDNLFWKLEKRGKYYIIRPKVNLQAALDAKGGKDRPYLNPEADPKNVNHLWILQKEGDFYKIFSKVGATE